MRETERRTGVGRMEGEYGLGRGRSEEERGTVGERARGRV